ncbi:hypothetical protein LTR99_000177 [Exophiala xenobiotica]|uniref:Heterokaryon incompatibility domain-containing protein n=1 Tax=Vermiconidia calcicola TaxID=1690605 RepID=A0AAV9PUW8_9PEZI|nr:hypothetical protein LTR96_009357 [Exophiala xenobiotica]KAK5530015.1 hypothetical protein LTR25_009259 [Vermiconidia calcicola]KAK5547334.1 hypothetical protein LTR23_002554 [Chaetothyriales sp. CCFEE 6169]KAK5307207.1 hypothetical protein LTR99_000177 [Exophiala xenobiotica]KAK5343888.1 hypothetical protein LTR98_001519 [Exophiala xenobiotica]
MSTNFEASHLRLQERVERIERQMDRLEHAVSAILERLEMPSVHELNSAVEGAGASPTQQADNIQFSNAPYSYRPLDLQNSEIRLLALNTAGKNTDELSGQLVHVSLDDEQLQAYRSKEFNALSYVWGEPKMDRPIYIDRHLLMITKNLESALRHAREQIVPDRQGSSRVAAPRYWWIDPICIHQTDLEERSSQVSLMRRVYKKAAAVKIWLGDAIEGSSTAMGNCAKNWKPSDPRTRRKGSRLPLIFKNRDFKALGCNATAARKAMVGKMLDPAGSGSSFLSSGIVGRLKLQTRYDPSSRNGHGIRHNSRLSSTGLGVKSSEPLRYNFYHHADDLRTLRLKSYEGHDFILLHDLMLASRDCQATDLRDKVFSTLGLADPEVYDIRADYRLPLPEVLKISARKILPQKGGLQLLGACQNPERRHELPSWVPNLIEQWRYQPFKPTYGSYLVNHEEPAIEFDGDTLLVQGSFVRNVTDVFEVDVTTNATDEQLDIIYEKWKSLGNVYASDIPYGFERPLYPETFTSKRFRDTAWMNFLSVDGLAWTWAKWADDETALPEPEEDLRRRKYPDLNLRLVRSYLVPDDFQRGLHPVQTIRNALKKYGPGRRLGLCAGPARVVKRRLLGPRARGGDVAKNAVLLPANARKGDVIAFFKGSTFPCVLRKHSNEDYILVDEACLDERATSEAWGKAQAAWRASQSMIRII